MRACPSCDLEFDDAGNLILPPGVLVELCARCHDEIRDEVDCARVELLEVSQDQLMHVFRKHGAWLAFMAHQDTPGNREMLVRALVDLAGMRGVSEAEARAALELTEEQESELLDEVVADWKREGLLPVRDEESGA